MSLGVEARRYAYNETDRFDRCGEALVVERRFSAGKGYDEKSTAEAVLCGRRGIRTPGTVTRTSV